MTEKTAEEKKAERKKSLKVYVNIPTLNIRTGPGFEHESKGFMPIGECEIEEVVDNGFGKLADGTGWIFMTYTKPMKGEKI